MSAPTIAEIVAWAEECAARCEGTEVEPELPPLPEPGTPERERYDAEQEAMVAGLLRVVLMQPPLCPSRPGPGFFCGRCGGQDWRQTVDGWHCTRCLPVSAGGEA